MQKLKDIMTREVEIIGPDADLTEIAEKMKAEDTGVLPVCDGDRIRGMVTDRDIVIRALAEAKDPAQTRASDIMSRGVFYLYDDDPIEEAAELMRTHQIRRIIVVDRNKRLCGIVSLGDLAVAAKKRLAGATLHDVSAPDSVQGYYKSLSKNLRSSRAGALALVGLLALGAVAFQYFGDLSSFIPTQKAA